MKTQDDYDQAVVLVHEVIHRWDPYGLLAGGCPPNEFEAEIARVVAQVPHIRSPVDAVNTLSRVFSSSFEAHLFRPEDCAVPGRELYEVLSAHKLLTE
jgi:hypothetical protein